MSTLGGLLVALLLALSWPPGAPPRPAADPSAPSAASTVVGPATWYPVAGRAGAAGPRLRRLLGRQWRGAEVLVCRTTPSSQACVRVRIVDWCACGHGRVIDLSPAAFRVLAPLSEGVVRVRVSRTLSVPLPPTDALP